MTEQKTVTEASDRTETFTGGEIAAESKGRMSEEPLDSDKLDF